MASYAKIMQNQRRNQTKNRDTIKQNIGKENSSRYQSTYSKYFSKNSQLANTKGQIIQSTSILSGMSDCKSMLDLSHVPNSIVNRRFILNSKNNDTNIAKSSHELAIKNLIELLQQEKIKTQNYLLQILEKDAMIDRLKKIIRGLTGNEGSCAQTNETEKYSGKRFHSRCSGINCSKSRGRRENEETQMSMDSEFKPYSSFNSRKDNSRSNTRSKGRLICKEKRNLSKDLNRVSDKINIELIK